MRTIHRILVVMAVSLLPVISCASASVTPLVAERPGEETSLRTLKMEPSTLNVPIEATTDDLARILNQAVRKDLYKGSTGTSGVTADVVRNGTIVVTAADDFLYVTLPIAMTLSYGMFETRPISLKLKFKATAGISPDWRLHTEIYYLGLSDLLSEEVGIGPLSFKPRSIVDGITRPVQKVLSDLVAQKINTLFPLKAQVAKVWNTAQKPVLLDKNYNAWLKLTPREVLLYPLYARNNRVRLSVGISTFTELVVGPEPAAPPPLPLPNLTQATAACDGTFRIALNADISYKELHAIAAPLLLNKRFDSDGKSVTITDFELYGNGDKLVVKLQTEGSLEGVFYLNAKPVFDQHTNVLSFEDVDFDMQTRSLLLRSANWFLHGSIRGILQEKLNTNFTRQLEQTRLMAGKALARVQLMDHVFLKGNLVNLKFNDMIVQKDKIAVQVYAEGAAGILFQ